MNFLWKCVSFHFSLRTETASFTPNLVQLFLKEHTVLLLAPWHKATVDLTAWNCKILRRNLILWKEYWCKEYMGMPACQSEFRMLVNESALPTEICGGQKTETVIVCFSSAGGNRWCSSRWKLHLKGISSNQKLCLNFHIRAMIITLQKSFNTAMSLIHVVPNFKKWTYRTHTKNTILFLLANL